MIELYSGFGVTLYIEEHVLSTMINTLLYYKFVESGGVLLGKKTIDNIYIITNIGTPTSRDTQKSDLFIRNKIDAQLLVDKAWSSSNGIINHLGEWHSHIGFSPYPSAQDISDIERAYHDGEFVFEHYFTIIITDKFQLFVGLSRKGKLIDSKITKVGKNAQL